MSAASRGARGQRRPRGRGGMLSRMSVPPMDSMPPIRTSFTRGLAATWSSPVIVGGTLAWLLVEWLIIVALGYPGPFALLAHVVAPAPLSTTTDLPSRSGSSASRKGLPLVFVAAMVHALWHSIVVGSRSRRSRRACQPVGGRPGAAGVPGCLRDPRLRGGRALHVVDRGRARGPGLRSSSSCDFILAVWVFAFAP